MIRIFAAILFCLMWIQFLPVYGFAQPGGQTGDEDKQKSKNSSVVIINDKFSLQTIAGVLYSPVYKRSSRPEINYTMINFRFIWSLNPDLTFRKPGLEGNFDTILELTHSFIFEGPGNIISGVTCLFRYNLPYSTDSIFPYIQIGGGIVYNDAYKDRSQILIGNNIEYNPQGSIGVRYLFKKNWSMDLEAMFHHLSNGGSDERNTSVNAIGALIGVTCNF